MEKSNLIEELKLLGFNEYKAKVFLVLLKGSIMTASEIAAEAKIVRSSIYDVLKIFVEKGYCNEIETNHVFQYQIIDPDIILDKIQNEYLINYRNKLDRLQSTFKGLKEIKHSINNSGKDEINLEVIRGYNKHRISKYMEFLGNAKKEIYGMYRFKGQVTAESDELAAKFIKKGGVIRSIYQITLDFKIQHKNKIIDATKEDLIKVCRKFEKSGEQIKLSKLKIPNMTITDGENVFLNHTDINISKQNQADIIFKKSSFAYYMMDLFNYYWDNALTIEEFQNLKN